MFKKAITFVLSIALVICLAVPAFAATDVEFLFDITAEGDYSDYHNIQVSKDDIITVKYVLTANCAEGVEALTQNEIYFDKNFFEFVDNSIILGSNGEGISSEYHLRNDGNAYVFFNNGYAKYFDDEPATSTIGSFKLKVKAGSGSTVIKNTSCGIYVLDNRGASFLEKNLSVTVKNDGKTVAVDGVVIDSALTAIKIGTTDTMSATVTPSDATNKSVTWSSSNNAVASVDTNGTVTAKAEGTATITATTVDGGKTATCTVTVTKGDVFTVNASCGTGGTITPSGEQIVKKGEDLAFSFKANENYAIKDVKIDGVSNAGAIESGSYTFRSVEENHTIAVAFEKTGDAPVINPFSDVKEGEYYYDAVLWAVENGVTQGTSTTTYSPNMLVTRAQMVTFLWRAAGCPEPTGSASKFTDVQRGSYYEKAVAWAIERGITKGTSATTFSPDTVCTRGQVVTLLARFAGVKDAVTQSVFSDVKSTDYFAAAVNWAKDNGVTSGTSATTFSPNADCTRGQIVTFLYRWMVR